MGREKREEVERRQRALQDAVRQLTDVLNGLDAEAISLPGIEELGFIPAPGNSLRQIAGEGLRQGVFLPAVAEDGGPCISPATEQKRQHPLQASGWHVRPDANSLIEEAERALFWCW